MTTSPRNKVRQTFIEVKREIDGMNVNDVLSAYSCLYDSLEDTPTKDRYLEIDCGELTVYVDVKPDGTVVVHGDNVHAFNEITHKHETFCFEREIAA